MGVSTEAHDRLRVLLHRVRPEQGYEPHGRRGGRKHLTRVGQSGADTPDRRRLRHGALPPRHRPALDRAYSPTRSAREAWRAAPSDQGRAKRRRRSRSQRRQHGALRPRHCLALDQACSPARSPRMAWRTAASDLGRAKRRRRSPYRNPRRDRDRPRPLRSLAVWPRSARFRCREPRLASPATQPTKTSVPHDTFNKANRCWLITLPPAVSSKTPPRARLAGTRRCGFSDQSVVTRGIRTDGCHLFPMCCRNTTWA